MYSKIFRTVLFPIMEGYQGTTIQKNLKLLQKTQWLSKREIEELQSKKLRALIKHAYENVPHYRKLLYDNNISPDDIKSITDLKKIPILTKKEIRNNLSQFIARNVPRQNMIEMHSSGSTGEPIKYFVNKSAYSAGWAQTFRCWSWAGYKIGDPYVKISLNPRDSYGKLIQDRLLNCKYILASEITERSIKKDINNIHFFNPKIIRDYASHMYTMAKMMEKFNIKSQGAVVATTGDMLYPHYRELIEKQFQCKIFDGYGGESTPVAFECEEHDGYHLCNEDVIVEFIADNDNVVAGELGRIVITNLNNYAMPFIRYDIGDIGKYSDDPCPCGRGLSMMKSIEGRDSDIISTPSGEFMDVHFFTTLFKHIQGVDQFQVIQERIDHLTMKIIKNQGINDDVLKYIKTEILRKAGPNFTIEIDFVNEIPIYGRSGKRRFVISKIPFVL